MVSLLTIIGISLVPLSHLSSIACNFTKGPTGKWESHQCLDIQFIDLLWSTCSQHVCLFFPLNCPISLRVCGCNHQNEKASYISWRQRLFYGQLYQSLLARICDRGTPVCVVWHMQPTYSTSQARMFWESRSAKFGPHCLERCFFSQAVTMGEILSCNIKLVGD